MVQDINQTALTSITTSEEFTSPDTYPVLQQALRPVSYTHLPESSRLCVEEANAKKVMIACHAGSTQQRSDIYGLQEAVEFARGQRLLMAHINAYCRGNRYHYLEELRDAFQMLRENPNIISDSHMAVNNGTSGACRNGIQMCIRDRMLS